MATVALIKLSFPLLPADIYRRQIQDGRNCHEHFHHCLIHQLLLRHAIPSSTALWK